MEISNNFVVILFTIFSALISVIWNFLGKKIDNCHERIDGFSRLENDIAQIKNDIVWIKNYFLKK